MSLQINPVFSFEEADHLKRIHMKLGLQDLGFPVREEDNQLIIDDPNKPTTPDDVTRRN
jgi:hypothetical protein